MGRANVALLTLAALVLGLVAGYTWSTRVHRLSPEDQLTLFQKKDSDEVAKAHPRPFLSHMSDNDFDHLHYSAFNVNKLARCPSVRTISVVLGRVTNDQGIIADPSASPVSLNGVRSQLQALYHGDPRVLILDKGMLLDHSPENRDHSELVLEIEVRKKDAPYVAFKGYYARYDPYNKSFGVYSELEGDCWSYDSDKVAAALKKSMDDYVKRFIKFQQ